MSKNENSISFDFSYFLSIGGVGVLFACAAVMAGIAFGAPSYGYYFAALFLLAAALVIANQLKKSKSSNTSVTSNYPTLKTDNMGVSMIMTSPAGDLVYANKAAKTLFEKFEFGEPKSPLKLDISNKNTIQTVLSSLGKDQIKMVVAEVRNTGEFLKFEVEKIQKNGDFYSWRIFEDAKAEVPLKIEATDPDSFDNLGRFFGSSGIGFFAISQNDKITYINDAFKKMLFGNGSAPDLPLDLSEITQHSTNNLKNTVRFNVHSGEKFSAQVVDWKGGVADDVSTYLVMGKEADASQAKSNDLQTGMENSFFWSSPIGIAIVSRGGEIKEKNVVFSNFIAGLDLEENDDLSAILTEENAIDVFKEIEKTVELDKPSPMIELRFKGLSDKQGQFYITKAKDIDDEVIVYLIDITEQKNLELQFSQSQKMQAVGQLAGGVAHDFNNLLTAITGFCDLLLVKHGPGDQSFSDIIQIKQNANRAANLVRQLLAFSRQQTLRPKVLIMTDVVAELSNLLRRLIGSNIELEMNHGRDIEPVRVDQGQLEQVIINLCVNARDAMPDGGKLEIKTRNVSAEESIRIGKRYQIFPKGEYVLLEVNDNGTGIAKEHLGKVFEPFFSTKDVGKGTGLGLSTVYGIIKQTNGFVFPESEVGVGTSFKIYLPKHLEGEEEEFDTVEEQTNADEPAQDLTGSSTILLVEDEDAVRMFASRALKNKGYTVYEADSGVSALNVLAETEAKIDLVISDVMMPQMDGPSLVKKIRETDSNLKVIFISGYAEDALDDNLMDKDFNFLSKPFSLKQLAEQVKEVLDK